MTQSPDAPTSASNSSAEDHARGAAFVDEAVLDVDLRNRIDAVASEERSHDERFRASRPVLIESALWLVVGVAIWALTILVWR